MRPAVNRKRGRFDPCHQSQKRLETAALKWVATHAWVWSPTEEQAPNMLDQLGRQSLRRMAGGSRGRLLGVASKDGWSRQAAVNGLPCGTVFDSARLPPKYALVA